MFVLAVATNEFVRDMIQGQHLDKISHPQLSLHDPRSPLGTSLPCIILANSPWQIGLDDIDVDGWLEYMTLLGVGAHTWVEEGSIGPLGGRFSLESSKFSSSSLSDSFPLIGMIGFLCVTLGSPGNPWWLELNLGHAPWHDLQQVHGMMDIHQPCGCEVHFPLNLADHALESQLPWNCTKVMPWCSNDNMKYKNMIVHKKRK